MRPRSPCLGNQGPEWFRLRAERPGRPCGRCCRRCCGRCCRAAAERDRCCRAGLPPVLWPVLPRSGRTRPGARSGAASLSLSGRWRQSWSQDARIVQAVDHRSRVPAPRGRLPVALCRVRPLRGKPPVARQAPAARQAAGRGRQRDRAGLATDPDELQQGPVARSTELVVAELWGGGVDAGPDAVRATAHDVAGNGR